MVHALATILKFLVKIALLAVLGAIIAAIVGLVRGSSRADRGPVTFDQWPAVPENRAA